jgi:hypothetical protein
MMTAPTAAVSAPTAVMTTAAVSAPTTVMTTTMMTAVVTATALRLRRRRQRQRANACNKGCFEYFRASHGFVPRKVVDN